MISTGRNRASGNDRGPPRHDDGAVVPAACAEGPRRHSSTRPGGRPHVALLAPAVADGRLRRVGRRSIRRRPRRPVRHRTRARAVIGGAASEAPDGPPDAASGQSTAAQCRGQYRVIASPPTGGPSSRLRTRAGPPALDSAAAPRVRSWAPGRQPCAAIAATPVSASSTSASSGSPLTATEPTTEPSTTTGTPPPQPTW